MKKYYRYVGLLEIVKGVGKLTHIIRKRNIKLISRTAQIGP